MSYIEEIKSIQTEHDYWVFFKKNPELSDPFPADSDGKVMKQTYGVCPSLFLKTFLSDDERTALADAARRAAENSAREERETAEFWERENEEEGHIIDGFKKIMQIAFDSGDTRVRRSKGGNGTEIIFSPGIVSGNQQLSGIAKHARKQMIESGLLDQ